MRHKSLRDLEQSVAAKIAAEKRASASKPDIVVERIVELLRFTADDHDNSPHVISVIGPALMRKAADEIERLRSSRLYGADEILPVEITETSDGGVTVTLDNARRPNPKIAAQKRAANAPPAMTRDEYFAQDIIDRLWHAFQTLHRDIEPPPQGGELDPLVFFDGGIGICVSDVITDAVLEIKRLRSSSLGIGDGEPMPEPKVTTPPYALDEPHAIRLDARGAKIEGS